ncbi:MAG TPA: exosortase system-associated protein, TIGR04073 family [Verrucomicrobiae bacterium]|jgi:putative exosortase-associated protein (TIGR04073 family)|nr:exosortase system-associated protein, TIGR04073 family [Verrucomicrobiae bacterium]
MRNILPILALAATTALLTSGCVGAQEKLGRGVRNTCEVVRLGGLRTSMEQTAVWNSPTEAATTGVVKGVCLSAARTGVGIYEVVTFPFPPYHPIARKYLTPLPTYPDNYRPSLPDDPLYQTDHYIGFTGGTAFGWVPGSQFEPLGH